jgi:AraC-like DNA-binding protein
MFIKAPFHLSPFIKEIWYWKNVDSNLLPWILPSYEIEAVFHLGNPPQVHSLEDKPIFLSSNHWVGPQKRRWKIESNEKLNLISLRFHAGAPWELMGVRTPELVNRFPEIDIESHALFLKLKPILNGTDSFGESDIGYLAEQIGEEIDNHQITITPINASIKFAFSELTNANAKVTDIARKTGLSRKQIERGMKKIYGLNPGELGKMHRILSLIRNPANYKSENSGGRLTDILHECGYVDQSHFINDFKRITGYLPKDWFKDFEKMSYFYNSNH